MGIGWRRQQRAARREGGSTTGPGEQGRATRTATAAGGAPTVIDLTEGLGWVARLGDPAHVAQLREGHRERAARREAQRDLERLRARHWSGERVIEEGRVDLDWWAHPEADPYAVLGLLPGVPLEDAAAARRRIAQACHPDRLREGDDTEEAQLRMVAANAAYDRLRRALRHV
ncbi:MAG: hypothetical protein ACSLFP_11710 [Acidimicrobiales bacterium]